jgi:hypothetical protein
VSEKEDQGLTPGIQLLGLTVGLTPYPENSALERRRVQDVLLVHNSVYTIKAVIVDVRSTRPGC